jgi:hypothetical protein
MNIFLLAYLPGHQSFLLFLYAVKPIYSVLNFSYYILVTGIPFKMIFLKILVFVEIF